MLEPSLAHWTLKLTCRGQRGRLEAVYRSRCGGRMRVTLRCRAIANSDDPRSLALLSDGADADVRFAAEGMAAVEDGLAATAELVARVLGEQHLTVAPLHDCAESAQFGRRRG